MFTGLILASTSFGATEDAVNELDRLLGAQSSTKSPAAAPSAAPSAQAKVVPSVAPTSGFGRMDASVVFAFHPFMLDFVLHEKNFLRNPPNVKSDQERQEKLTHLWRKSVDVYSSMGDLRRKVMDDYDKIGQERVKRYARFQADEKAAMDSMRKSLAKDPGAAQTINAENSSHLKGLETEYWKDVAQFDRREFELNGQVDQVNAQVVGHTLLTRPELAGRIQQMATDIQEGVEVARREFGLVAVLNDGYLTRSRPVSKESPHFDAHPSNLFAFANPYRDFLKSGKAPQPGDPDMIQSSAGSDREAWLLQRHYQDRAELAQPLWTSDFNQLVLTGGRDVTVRVLTHVLDKHRFPAGKRDEVLKFVAKIRSGVAEPAAVTPGRH